MKTKEKFWFSIPYNFSQLFIDNRMISHVWWWWVLLTPRRYLMRRLVYPALILLPVLAHAQAQTQTSTLTASPSRASMATLEAKATKPNLPTAAAPAAANSAADPGTEIMVPIHQTVVEH